MIVIAQFIKLTWKTRDMYFVHLMQIQQCQTPVFYNDDIRHSLVVASGGLLHRKWRWGKEEAEWLEVVVT